MGKHMENRKEKSIEFPVNFQLRDTVQISDPNVMAKFTVTFQ